MGHVYISYSRKDTPFAHRLAEALRARHISVWYDTESIAAGSDWARVINDAISDADAVVAILSPDAVQSKWIQREHEYAIQHYKPIFPIMVQDTRLPPELAMIQYIDARGNWDRAVEQLVHVLAALTPAPGRESIERSESAARREPSGRRKRRTPAAPPAAPSFGAPAPAALYETREELPARPKRRVRWAWMALALLVGVISAAVVLGVLTSGAGGNKEPSSMAQPSLQVDDATLWALFDSTPILLMLQAGDSTALWNAIQVHSYEIPLNRTQVAAVLTEMADATQTAGVATGTPGAPTQPAATSAALMPTATAPARTPLPQTGGGADPTVTRTGTALPTRTSAPQSMPTFEAAAPGESQPHTLTAVAVGALATSQAAVITPDAPTQVAALNVPSGLDSAAVSAPDLAAESAADLAAERLFEARVATEVEFAVAGTTTALRATDESDLSLSEAGVVAAMITKATAEQDNGGNTRLLWAFNLGLLGLLAVGGLALLLTRTRRPFRSTAHSPAHPVKAPAPLPQDYQVFISSSDADKAWVSRFVRDLGDMGYVSWWYAKDAPGLPFGQEIVRAIFYTKIFVVVVSPDSMESKHVEEEIRLADRFDRPIITVIYRPTDERLYGLAKSSDIDFSDEREYKGAMEFLTQAFNQLLERHRQASGPGAETPPGPAHPGPVPPAPEQSGAAQTPPQAAP